eukprot:TRINITY_DN3609_c0_g1_i4.p1 TRINITY_DN3609_c0_g1~~TRINITY_DN3609_c0_g1_i4.p1  ORF type:complete len:147 (-),score=25.02 TRINITY_DN3609_c0_g1_i4:1006-1446(-)
MPDCEIPLSEKGLEESRECGKRISQYFTEVYGSDKHPEGSSCRMWVSPFYRARQTADCIIQEAENWISTRTDNLLLVEQQFGMFEGVDWLSVEKDYPNEIKYYRRASQCGGKFWIKMPLYFFFFFFLKKGGVLFLKYSRAIPFKCN